jgi:hypothetical protein
MMNLLGNKINLFAAIITLVIGMTSMDNFSLSGLVFLISALSPYVFMIWVLSKIGTLSRSKEVSLLFIVIAICGVTLLVYSMYIQKDAQSALAFVVIPMYQWGILLLASLPLYFIYKKNNKEIK